MSLLRNFWTKRWIFMKKYEHHTTRGYTTAGVSISYHFWGSNGNASKCSVLKLGVEIQAEGIWEESAQWETLQVAHFTKLRIRWENDYNGSYGNRISQYGLDSSGTGLGPVAGSCDHGNKVQVPLQVGNFLTIWVTMNFSMTLLHEVSKVIWWPNESIFSFQLWWK